MHLNIELIFLLSIALVSQHNCVKAVGDRFVQEPQSQTKYYGEVALFSCIIDFDLYGGITWFIYYENRWTVYYGLPDEYGAVAQSTSLSNNQYLRTLSINANEVSNNTQIYCRGDQYPIDGEPSVSSHIVTLSVQGIPPAPFNLNTALNNNSISLFWSRPFVLPETELHYTVKVTINNQSHTLNTTSLHYNFPFTVLNLNTCIPFNVTFAVRANNPAGSGDFASFVYYNENLYQRCSHPAEEMQIEVLSAPTGLKQEVNNTCIQFAWNEVFTFTLIYHYDLVFKIQQDSLNPTFIKKNTTEANFLLCVDYFAFDICNGSIEIELSVSGHNSAGIGNATSITVELSQECPSTESKVTTLSSFVRTTSKEFQLQIIDISIGFVTVGGVVSILLMAVICILCVYVPRKKKRKFNLRSKEYTVTVEKNDAYGVAGQDVNNLQNTTNISYGVTPAVEPFYEEIGAGSQQAQQKAWYR